MSFPRGAIPTPRAKLAGAIPHKPMEVMPSQFLWPYVGLSMWGNDVNGDCVTAEEAAAKSCKTPGGGVLITEQEAIAWATAHGVLNGAELQQVMQMMLKDGFQQGGSIYDDGNANSLDWTDATILQSAVAIGPVKIGIAADQIQTAYDLVNPATGGVSGWFATGFTQDDNVDHCTHLSGYAPILWLSQQIEALCQQLGLAFAPLPTGVDGTKPGYAMFTWKTVGIIDVPSFLAICGEAWIRNPTTVVVPLNPPGPPPQPAPPPKPVPSPPPVSAVDQEARDYLTALAQYQEGAPLPPWA